jgi:hypothetical protein
LLVADYRRKGNAMNGIMVDDLLEPLNDVISKNTLSKIPKQNKGTVKQWTSSWRRSKDGKLTCLEFKRVK